MDRPLGKKFDPRPKRIQRSDGSHWVANPCVSEHFLTKQIGEIDRQKTQYNATQSKHQKELQRELRNIKVTKSHNPGPGYFRRRGNKQQSLIETSFSDMIDKFNKRRVEQHLMNNLLKQKRENMYNKSAGTNRKSVSHIWDNIVDDKATILKFDFEQNSEDPSEDDFENIRNFDDGERYIDSREKQRIPFRRTGPRRKQKYEVKKDRFKSETGEHEKPEETSYKFVPRPRPSPSYAKDRTTRDFTPVSEQTHHKPRGNNFNKTKTRRAANLWGLVREKALGPDDLKCLKQKMQSHGDTGERHVLNHQMKTDDQKLLEKELNNASVKTDKKSFFKINKHSNPSAEKKLNKDLNDSLSSASSTREKNVTEKSCKLDNKHPMSSDRKNLTNTDSKLCSSSSKEKVVENNTTNNIPNGHISNAEKNSARFLKSSAKNIDKHESNSARPKSAKLRTRVRSRHMETEKEDKITLSCDDQHDDVIVVPAVCGDDASLNNFLYCEMSENEIRDSDRKMSSFDLNVEDSFYEHRRPSERMSQVSDFSENLCHIDHHGDKWNRKTSSGSRRNSVSSRKSNASKKSSQNEETLEKLRKEKESEELWDDVRRCRYLRGYDPPEMIMPANVNVFVFGKDENDIIEELRMENVTKSVKDGNSSHRD